MGLFSFKRPKSAINRDRAYKSSEPHEQAYKRKKSPKNPKYKTYANGGGVKKFGKVINRIKLGQYDVVVKKTNSPSNYNNFAYLVRKGDKIAITGTTFKDTATKEEIKKWFEERIPMLEKQGFAKGGSVNIGRSWHLDRQKRNKSEDWELPMYKRKQKYADGGGVEDDLRKRFDSYTDEELQIFNGENEETLKNWNREDAIREAINTSIEENEFRKGGSVNTGRSWHLDRQKRNKSEDWELPMYKRKQKYADGGGVNEKFKVGDKVKIDYISDNSEHNGEVGTITWLNDYNYYPKGDESVVEIKTQGEITYSDGSIEFIGDFYRKGSGLVSPVEKMAKGGRIKSAIMRDRKYKSQEPHEQAYNRKTRPKNLKYKTDKIWFANGGDVKFDNIMTNIPLGAKVVIVANLDDHIGYSGEELEVIAADDDNYYVVENSFGMQWYVGEEELKIVNDGLKYEYGGELTDENMVRQNLINGEISQEVLTQIIGCEPEYPYQIVGAIKLKKCFLKPYYKLA